MVVGRLAFQQATRVLDKLRGTLEYDTDCPPRFATSIAVTDASFAYSKFLAESARLSWRSSAGVQRVEFRLLARHTMAT